MSISRYGRPFYLAALGLIISIGAGLALAYIKIHMLADAVIGRMCEVSDTCVPTDAADQGLGFMALAGMTGYLHYPVSLVIALFVPQSARRFVLWAVFLVVVSLGLFLDLVGFGIVLFMTMMFAMVALEDFLKVGILFAVLHSALAVLLLGRLHKPAAKR